MKSLRIETVEMLETSDGFTVMAIREPDAYDLYLKKPGYAFKFMFGLPHELYMVQGMKIAVANIPDYQFLFDDEA